MPLDGAIIQLLGDQTRRVACEMIQRVPDGWICKIDKPRRTLQQSSRFWAVCGDVAKSGFIWGGSTLPKDDWHTLFLSAWNIAEHRPARLVIGLENELVNLIPQSRSLTVEQMSSLIDYCTAWAVMHGIELGATN